ncbi:MAG: AhpC/TSA family protein [Bosea sp.]|nr:AhpC/TSA family protein [Bosea sp. (in: a-proteobacteria)]OJV07140.1 MAG: alkyl hydroperoxide reductase [Bosea sp. 67-29]
MAAMALKQQLEAFRAEFARTAPEGRVALYEAKIEELRASFAEDKAIGVGDRAPGFALPGIAGRQVVLEDLLRQGPVVLTFYRGGWCPYCNFQLRAYQAALPQMVALGARLVAVSPQLPDNSLGTAEKNALTFDVLSDVGNVVARRYGLVYALPHELREALRSNDKALSRINGDESWELPVPATYVIGEDGRVMLASLHIDYRTRLDPEAILAALRTARS